MVGKGKRDVPKKSSARRTGGPSGATCPPGRTIFFGTSRLFLAHHDHYCGVSYCLTARNSSLYRKSAATTTCHPSAFCVNLLAITGFDGF